MKTTIIVILFSAFFFFTGTALPQYRNLKENLAVIDFENKTTFNDIGSTVQDILTTALWKCDRFILIEREKIQEILREQDFSHSGRVSVEGAIEIGRILGAEYIITGGITSAGLVKESGGTVSRIALDARLVNVTSSQIVLAEDAFGEAMGTDINIAIRDAVNSLVPKITEVVDKKEWQSQVMKVSEQKIYINAGSEHGIKKADKLAVYKRGEELVDPKTGAIVGYVTEKISMIEIVKVQPKYSVSTLIEGREPEKGDIVREK